MRGWTAAPLICVLALGGCAENPFDALKSSPSEAPQAPLDVTAPPPPPEAARTAEEFDTTSAEQRSAATEVPQTPETRLGSAVASLGDPAMPGFWARTAFVEAPRPGRLADPATGKSVQVELRPRGSEAGAGLMVSLPALRVLEVPLTALVELEVYAHDG